MATKTNFKDSLEKIKDTEQTLSTGSLYAFSSLEPENQTLFEEAWAGLPPERQRHVASALAELAEDNLELDFSSIFFFLLNDANAQVRNAAIEGLWEDESRELLSKLLSLLASDPDSGVREKVALGLSRFAYLAEVGKLKERWSTRLREALLAQCAGNFNDVPVGRRALEALGYFGEDDQIIKLIERAYASDDELLKASALKAMGRSVNKRWLPEVGKELSSREPSLRYEAATAAGEMGSEELLQPVIRLTEDDDREVQLAAIWALGQIGGPEASRILKHLTGDENETISNAAKDALTEISFASSPMNVLGNG